MIRGIAEYRRKIEKIELAERIILQPIGGNRTRRPSPIIDFAEQNLRFRKARVRRDRLRWRKILASARALAR